MKHGLSQSVLQIAFHLHSYFKYKMKSLCYETHLNISDVKPAHLKNEFKESIRSTALFSVQDILYPSICARIRLGHAIRGH